MKGIEAQEYTKSCMGTLVFFNFVRGQEKGSRAPIEPPYPKLTLFLQGKATHRDR